MRPLGTKGEELEALLEALELPLDTPDRADRVELAFHRAALTGATTADFLDAACERARRTANRTEQEVNP